ncbi:ROK family glucokinase [Ornithinibacillus sp. BX22]|uniref:Glucokinase n=2 Tax=Ornithinibacillus TaxID=484508 RepID=A0A923L688_9BACI|nr:MULTISPECIES: ROK family glucokinase [Ornithinibacillus]MBC5637209.1 ROK family glucokinase [Ornithinibacillus hominis]MBS3679580.1 ROK family glucokinase [Ornithinibacillus massiliensis]
MNKSIIVGVDIGGTTVKIGILKASGEIMQKWEIETNKSSDDTAVMNDIWESVLGRLTELAIDLHNVLGIGIGAPGFIDGEKGYVYEAVNLGWKDFNLADYMSSKTGLPVYVENDANIAVLGENWLGAGNQSNDILAVTLGTGVGGGVIAGGKIINGVNGTAGEIGHITVDPNGYPCNCGRKGCLETIASATGIVRQAEKFMEDDPSCKLAQIQNQYGAITAKHIFELAANGDENSIQIVNHTADILGLVLANLAVTVNPSKILIGGGVSKAGDQLLQPIKKSFTKYALARTSRACEIRIAELGNDAGIIGAAYLVIENSN